MFTMVKRRLYTVLYLLVIFVYPVIVQPWHIIQHHGHEDSWHIDETDHSYGLVHHLDSNCSYDSVLPPGSLINQDHSNDPCYICEYNFPVQDLPINSEPGFVAHQFKELQSVNLFISDEQEVYSLVNPRAPPSSSSKFS